MHVSGMVLLHDKARPAARAANLSLGFRGRRKPPLPAVFLKGHRVIVSKPRALRCGPPRCAYIPERISSISVRAYATASGPVSWVK